MRRLLVFQALLLIFLSNYAQKDRKYFEENICSLDPIEGIYSAEITKIGKNSFQTFPPIKETQEFVVYKNGLGILYMGDDWIKIERVGETNVYNFNVKFESTSSMVRVYLYDNIHFSLNFDIPQEQLRRDMGGSYQAGMRVNFNIDCVKKYPTTSMYAEAHKKKSEEALQPQQWSGTGFALLEGHVVTNYHVVEGAKSIMIQGVNDVFSQKLPATVIASDKINDIAILKLNGNLSNTSLPFSVKTFTSDVGEDVWVLGYPLTSTMGDEIKLTTGVISAKSGYEGDVAMYQISAPVQPGSSGGPVFDKKGNLIGIVCAHHRGAENVSYAIKASYLRNLVESSVNHDIFPHANKLSTLDLAGQVKSVKQFVYYITCNK